jgi:tyrosine-protein phosphatase YwqE
MLDNLFEERLKADDLLLMDDDTVLVETSTWNPPTNLYWILKEIMKAGYHPLFAHPERCRYLEDKDYGKLVDMGVRFQLNLASLTGYYGGTAQKKAQMILKNGWYSRYGSDCHRLATVKEQYSRETLSQGDVALLKNI